MAIEALLRLTEKINGRPKFSNLYQLSQRLTKRLRKVHHPIHRDDGYAGYILSEEAYTLLSTAAWRYPVDVSEFFIVPDTAITNTEQNMHKRMWQARKDLQDIFNNFQTEFKMMFERIINLSYHSDGMGRTGFVTDKVLAILHRLHTLYGKPSLGELDAALLHLYHPMDRNQLVEVTIHAIKGVQLFLLSHTKYNISLPNTALINYAMIKINKTGIYPKALAR